MLQTSLQNPYISRKPAFSSINGNLIVGEPQIFKKAFIDNPKENQLYEYSTWITRDLSSQLAITNIIKDKPADIHILGCSDGTSAYAYAFAAKKQSGKDADKQVKIIGIDNKPSLVEMAKSGYLVCTDTEKILANHSHVYNDSPLANGGWDKYLSQQAKGPENFNELTKKYPELSQITREYITGSSIGNGMNWYKVNTDGLPETEFIQSDMRDYVRRPPSEKKTQVYVMANSAAYLAAGSVPQFLNLIEDIKNQNIRKDTYLVFGDMELNIFKQAPSLKETIKRFGFEPLSKEQLRNTGVQYSDEIYEKIWKLKEGLPPPGYRYY